MNADSYYVDLERDELCIIILDYCFDSLFFNNDNRFSEKYILTMDQFSENSTRMHLNLGDKFPIIVQYFNEYGIYYSDKCILCPDFVTCFIEWIRIACEDENINGIFAGEATTTNLLFLYEKFFQNNREHLNYLKKKLNVNLSMQEFGIFLPKQYNEKTISF